MHSDEVFKHRAREQIIKTITHLHNARHHVDKTFKRLRIVYGFDQNCNVAKQNCEALRAGINETIKMLANTAQHIKSTFANATERPPPIVGGSIGSKLTPKQRDLEQSGHLQLKTLPTYTLPRGQKTIIIMQFKPKIKPKKPKRDPQNIPI